MNIKDIIFPPYYQFKWNLPLFLLISSYLAGLIGISTNVHPDFIRLTPFSLLLSLVIVIYCFEGYRKKLLFYMFATFCWGFTMEVIGVNTGQLFGEYSYGSVLGWKLLKTPLLIGVNWFLLSYGTGMLVNFIFPQVRIWIKVIIGALFMVFLDIFIEPVAIQYDFWFWELGHPPVRNYIGWFFVALPPMALFFQAWPQQKDKIGLILIIMQYVFFGGLLIVHKLFLQ